MRLAEKCHKTACLRGERPKWLASVLPDLTQAVLLRLSGGIHGFEVPRETLKRPWGVCGGGRRRPVGPGGIVAFWK